MIVEYAVMLASSVLSKIECLSPQVSHIVLFSSLTQRGDLAS